MPTTQGGSRQTVRFDRVIDLQPAGQANTYSNMLKTCLATPNCKSLGLDPISAE
jgi:hypothetical protein